MRKPPPFLSIKNFSKYQHYKHRNPPWIKLHLEILDDPDFLQLPDASKWHYIGLLLLASKHENALPWNESYVRSRTGMTEKLDLNHRFLKDHVLASGKHRASKMHTNADSETETETETERERECASAACASTSPPHPPIPLREKEKRRSTPLPEEFTFTPELREWALAKGCKEPFAEFERFCAKAIAKGWTYVDWPKAYHNWVLNELKWAREKNHAAM